MIVAHLIILYVSDYWNGCVMERKIKGLDACFGGGLNFRNFRCSYNSS